MTRCAVVTNTLTSPALTRTRLNFFLNILEKPIHRHTPTHLTNLYLKYPIISSITADTKSTRQILASKTIIATAITSSISFFLISFKRTTGITFVILLKIHFLLAVVCLGDESFYLSIGEGVQLLYIDFGGIHSHSYADLVAIHHLQGVKTSNHVQRDLQVGLSQSCTNCWNHIESAYLLRNHILVVSEPTVAQRVNPGLILWNTIYLYQSCIRVDMGYVKLYIKIIRIWTYIESWDEIKGFNTSRHINLCDSGVVVWVAGWYILHGVLCSWAVYHIWSSNPGLVILIEKN